MPILADSLSVSSDRHSISVRECVGAIMMLRSEWNWDADHAQHVNAVAVLLARFLPLELRR